MLLKEWIEKIISFIHEKKLKRKKFFSYIKCTFNKILWEVVNCVLIAYNSSMIKMNYIHI